MSLELDQAKTALVVIDMTKGVVSLASGPSREYRPFSRGISAGWKFCCSGECQFRRWKRSVASSN